MSSSNHNILLKPGTVLGKTYQIIRLIGQASSDMIQSELISVKDPQKYYTDTSFRVALDLPRKKQ